MGPQPAGIEIRKLTANAEFAEAIRLQQLIWGFTDLEVLPLHSFVVVTGIGGQAFGAFDDQRMIGFSVAFPGLKPEGKPYLHSDMLGVLSKYRNRGIGRLLKLQQREEALAHSLDLIEWTFDPLEIKNAYFNMERLGAVVRRFVLNRYGTTGSFLHGGLPTDRCVAEWWISSRRVASIVSGQPPARPAVQARIQIPTVIERLRREDPGQAREIQKSVSEQFLKYCGQGLVAIGFERSQEAGTYLLGAWESD